MARSWASSSPWTMQLIAKAFAYGTRLHLKQNQTDVQLCVGSNKLGMVVCCSDTQTNGLRQEASLGYDVRPCLKN